jgi:uncharacterized membrane protein YeaQ/YmgE (transglycosylase-associated protein family)
MRPQPPHCQVKYGYLILKTVVGIVGALIGGFPFGYNTINQNVFDLSALLISLVGAVVLLTIVNLIRRGALR